MFCARKFPGDDVLDKSSDMVGTYLFIRSEAMKGRWGGGGGLHDYRSVGLCCFCSDVP